LENAHFTNDEASSMVYSDGTKVTIGLCVKNAEPTIKECINSVAYQTFPHEFMEIIVVDACSQDRTLSIIKERLAKTDIKKRFFSENIGLGFARQTVVENARGQYIIWVDGDIILSKDYIQNQVNFMEQHASVAITVGSLGILPDDNWVATLENMGYVIDSLRYQGEATSNLLGTKGSIFRVKAIKGVGGFDPNIKGAQEDMDVAYKIRMAGWKFYMTKALFFHRQRRTWKDIWKQHFWYGYGLHFIQHKNKGQNMISDKSVDRIILSSLAYRLTHRKVVFLLPLNFIFKETALLFGFAKAHVDGYGHKGQI
jgi:glycosyltransferase involved in cell wall biosynthesis